MKSIEREITPLKDEDFFIVLNNQKAKFDFPVHYHPEYELNYVINSKGKRVIGDSNNSYESRDLILVGPNTPHAWSGENDHDDAHVITIQFHGNILHSDMLDKKIMAPIRNILNTSYRGISFSKDTIDMLHPRMIALCEKSGFDSLLEFLSILYDLSISRNQQFLSSPSYVNKQENTRSRRIKKVIDYIKENYQKPIKIKEMADMVNMSETAFSHFFKTRTQRSFTDYLTDFRVGYSSRMLMESEKSIAEICFECGFNNISNYNRIFKKKKGCTPSEFKKQQLLISKTMV